MNKSKKKVIVALVAATAIAMSLMSTAFAAPATTTSTCPKTAALQSLLSGSSLPTSIADTTANNQTLQQLLSKYSSSLPTSTAGTTASTCPKQQALQKLLGQYGASTPTTGATTPTTTTTTPTATPAPTTGVTTGSTTPVSGNMSADESKMIDLVNQDRSSNGGLKALTFDSKLRAGALTHSQDMSTNNYFSHTSPTLGDFSTRLQAAGITNTAAGENIALYPSVEQAEVGFMNSPGHRANILGDYTRVGIGIVYNQSKGQYYITQWFAK